MYIERSIENRAGKRVGDPHRERVPSKSRDDAQTIIEQQQASYPHNGYNAQQDRWWARHDGDEYQVTLWIIYQGDFE